MPAIPEFDILYIKELIDRKELIMKVVIQDTHDAYVLAKYFIKNYEEYDELYIDFWDNDLALRSYLFLGIELIGTQEKNEWDKFNKISDYESLYA